MASRFFFARHSPSANSGRGGLIDKERKGTSNIVSTLICFARLVSLSMVLIFEMKEREVLWMRRKPLQPFGVNKP